MSLVSVSPEGLQPTPDRASQGQLIAQMQELLHHWVLWSAVKSRWVIVGKWLPTLLPLCLAASTQYRSMGADSRKERVGIGSPPPPANDAWVGIRHSL